MPAAVLLLILLAGLALVLHATVIVHGMFAGAISSWALPVVVAPLAIASAVCITVAWIGSRW